jgi:succinylarginine dihydrolase
MLCTAQQAPEGIDAGAFHTDVLAVGTGGFLMLHEHAFVEHPALLRRLRAQLGEQFTTCLATQAELPVADAVSSYPFNSQLIALPTAGDAAEIVIVAPLEAQENPAASRFLARVVAADNPVCRVEYQDVRQSMSNGGGPACLRLRVALTEDESARLHGRVFLNDALYAALREWVTTHYRDQLTLNDLRDPSLFEESNRALDELTELLALGPIYDFQR